MHSKKFEYQNKMIVCALKIEKRILQKLSFPGFSVSLKDLTINKNAKLGFPINNRPDTKFVLLSVGAFQHVIRKND
jgi:hypothetical protein